MGSRPPASGFGVVECGLSTRKYAAAATATTKTAPRVERQRPRAFATPRGLAGRLAGAVPGGALLGLGAAALARAAAARALPVPILVRVVGRVIVVADGLVVVIGTGIAAALARLRVLEVLPVCVGGVSVVVVADRRGVLAGGVAPRGRVAAGRGAHGGGVLAGGVAARGRVPAGRGAHGGGVLAGGVAPRGRVAAGRGAHRGGVLAGGVAACGRVAAGRVAYRGGVLAGGVAALRPGSRRSGCGHCGLGAAHGRNRDRNRNRRTALAPRCAGRPAGRI